MNNNSQRIEWIDLAKTFMIMVVIFCHVPQYDTIEKAFFYSFQMPFFFFVSGFLHKRVDILSERFHKYWKTLLIPYFIFQIIYYPYYLVQNVLQDGRDIHNILDWGIEPLIETIIGLPLNGPTWFIFSLFIMKAIIDLGHKEKNQFVYLLLFLCTSFIISYLFIMKDDSIKISFCIDGTAKYMPYFILRQIFKLKFSKQMRNTSNRYIVLSLSILFTIATILALEMIRCGTINSNYILYYCIAALGTSSVILFCKFINKSPDLIKIISSGTIVILGTHWMFIGFINFVVEKAFVIQAVKYSTLVATIVVLFITFVNYFIIKFCMKHFTIILGGRHTNKKKYDN